MPAKYSEILSGTPCARGPSGHRTLLPTHRLRWDGTEKQEDPDRELARGAGRWRRAGSEGLSGIGRHRAIDPKGSWCSYHREPFTYFTPCLDTRPGDEKMGLVHLVPVGRDAVLVGVSNSAEAVSLAAWARERRLATDVVPGARTVLLDGLADLAGLDRLAELLSGWQPTEMAPGPLVELAVTYDGPDLGEVAEHWGCDVDEVVERHTTARLVSAFCGFAPGFAYLSGLEAEVPRLATPRTRVPAGSVALAGRWCGVYPTSSPGGWRIIGHTDAVLWDPARAEPALLSPGTRVRFVAR
jgi:KipI family sensor histidine kinase inhibitor